MFGWEFPPQFSGGLGVACYGLSRALARAGVRVTLVLPSVMPITSPYVRVRFAYLPAACDTTCSPESYAHPLACVKMCAEGAFYGSGLLHRVRAYGRAARAIAREEAFDLIHAHDWLTIPAALEAKRASGKPLVLHIHATEFDRSGGSGAHEAVYAIEKAGMEAADAVVVVSNYTKNIVETRYGIPSHKITVAHNGIDEDHLRMLAQDGGTFASATLSLVRRLKRAGARFVLFAGRITLQKGPDYFVELARRVLALRSDTYFFMIGTGDMRGQILDQIAAAGLSGRFFLHGYYTHPELEALLDVADLYVFPSVSEPFGIVPLEAAQRGTPVILSKQSGVAEVFKHALTVDFWDIDEMVNKTIALLDNPALADTLHDNSRSEVRLLGWENVSRKIRALYRALLAS